MKACAFTGYRPEKLPFGSDETDPRCEQLKQRLFCEILKMTREDVHVFLCGMARGVDMWAAETVLQIQAAAPLRRIQLWAIVPYDRQALAWSAQEQTRYQRILKRASRIEYVSHEYYEGCLQKRNRYMVDHASRLLAVYDGKSGGTASTIRYAQQKGLDIAIIEP